MVLNEFDLSQSDFIHITAIPRPFYCYNNLQPVLIESGLSHNLSQSGVVLFHYWLQCMLGFKSVNMLEGKMVYLLQSPYSLLVKLYFNS